MVAYFVPPAGGLAFADLFPAGVPDLAVDMLECVHCSGSFPADDAAIVTAYQYGRRLDPGATCPDCRRVCDWCAELTSICSVQTVSSPNYPGGRHHDREICVSCLDRLSRCSICSTMFDLVDEGGVVDYDHYCQNCLDSRASFCQGCDSYTFGDVCGECDQCDGCGCDDSCSMLESCNSRGELHPYDYKPIPEFFGTGPLFLGFELEMETGGAQQDRAHYVRSISSDLERCYLKHDGSLLHGIELVTHPMSPVSLGDWWPSFVTVLESLRRDGVTSWIGHRCGFHVHLSRSAFAGPRHLFAFTLFVYRNAGVMQALSGRRTSELNAYARLDLHRGDLDPRDSRLMDKVRNHHYGGARHVAVNLTNARTVEVRLFRGSLRHETLRGYLDLVLAVFDYTRALTVRDIHGGALSWVNFREWVGGPFGTFPALVALERHRRNTGGVS